MKFVVFSILFLAIAVIPAAFADSSGGFGSTRSVGVPPGAQMIYDLYQGGLHIIDNITVSQVSGTVIYFNETWTVNGYTFVPYGNKSLWTNVDGQVFQATRNGTTSEDYLLVGQPDTFIGSGLLGGPEYPGSSTVMLQSVFGHIVLGQWRSTNYWDDSVPKQGFIYHYEWDRNTGILLSYQLTYNGAGTAMFLRSTNLWQSSPYWVTVGASLAITRLVAPWIGLVSMTYILSFGVVAFYDWRRVKVFRSRGSAKQPSIYWQQIKILIVAILITMGILALLLYLVGVALRAS